MKNILSIVIICKNESENIERCIKSVLSLPNDFNYEVILIDSNSTDNTLDIAKKFDISIFQLKSKWKHNAAVARYLGSKKCSGKYILFLDGDMELDTAFLNKGIHILEKDKAVGAVSGKLSEYTYENKQLVHKTEDVYNVEFIGKRYDMGGVFIIKNSILQEIGNFDINLDANEDLDLCYRIYAAGYSFVRLPEVIAIHHTETYYSIKGIHFRYKSNRYTSIWKVLFKSVQNKYLKLHLNNMMHIIIWTIMLYCALISSFLYIFFKFNFMVILVQYCMLLFIILYKLIRKRNIKLTVLDIYQLIVTSFSILKKDAYIKQISNYEPSELIQIK